MKQTLKKLTLIALSLFMIPSLFSCRCIICPPTFEIGGIDNNPDKDYFNSESYDFTRVETVVLIPYLQIYDNYDYRISIIVYSETGSEQVIIKKLILKEGDECILIRNLNQEVAFEEAGDSIYKGYVRQNFVEVLEVESGKKFTIIVEAEVLKDGKSVSRTITYDANMLLYAYPGFSGN